MTKRFSHLFLLLAWLLVGQFGGQFDVAAQAVDSQADLPTLLRQFEEYSGAALVFDRDDLPDGRYHDVLKPLVEKQRVIAAKVCIEEAKMYPPRYFEEVGLKAVGVFAVCASRTTSDRSRPYDAQLGGYRYFGVYNGTDAVAAAFETEGQLALTFHHEIFHHVDSTVDGETGSWALGSDDAVYQAAISGHRPHRAPPIMGEDLANLRQRRIGLTLQDAVSEYAAKNSREDQAETARHVMSMLPSSLVQSIDQPELPGSQRILHVLQEYAQSVPDGPGFDWWVDVALGRARRDVNPETVDELLIRLRAYAEGGQSGFAGLPEDPRDTRAALASIVRVKAGEVTADQAAEMVQLATQITEALLWQRIRPDNEQRRFDIWGYEDSEGINRTLRHDVRQFSDDVKRLKLIATIHQPHSTSSMKSLTDTCLKNLRLIARYYTFIKTNWSMTPGTHEVFESARQVVVNSLPIDNASLAQTLQTTELVDLARIIPEDGQIKSSPPDDESRKTTLDHRRS